MSLEIFHKSHPDAKLSYKNTSVIDMNGHPGLYTSIFPPEGFQKISIICLFYMLHNVRASSDQYWYD